MTARRALLSTGLVCLGGLVSGQELPTCTLTSTTDFQDLVSTAFSSDLANLADVVTDIRNNFGLVLGTRQAYINGKLSEADNTVFAEARRAAEALLGVAEADFAAAFQQYVETYITSPGGRAFLYDLIPTVEMNAPGSLRSFTEALFEARAEFACTVDDGLTVEQVQQIDLATAATLNEPLADLSADDELKPLVYPSPPGGWNNDPYIVYDEDNNLHIFYQLNPFAINWGHIHWGHMAIPADSPGTLEQRPIALEPRPDDGYVHCFSGSLLGNKIPDPEGGNTDVTAAFFTATGSGEGGYVSFLEAPPAVMAVTSDDDLDSWNPARYAVTNSGTYLNSVDTINGNEAVTNRYDIRDPVVFQRDGEYFMMQAGTAVPGRVGQGVIVLLKPSDPTDLSAPWQYVGDMFRHPQAALEDEGPGILETPGFQQVGNKDILLFGAQRRSDEGNLRNFNYRQGVQYFLGSFDSATGAFTADSDEPQYFEYGRAVYAMSAQPRPTFDGESPDDNDPQATLLAWILGYDSSEEWSSVPRGWQGALYLPMTMSLSADGDLLVAPDARVLSAKRVEPAIYNCDEIFEFDADGDSATNVNERTFELRTTITLDATPVGSESVATIQVLADGENSIAITYDGTEIRILDEAMPVDLVDGEASVEVSIVVDRMVIGVYAQGKMLHKVIDPPRLEDDSGYASGTRLSISGGSGEFADVCAWRLQNDASGEPGPDSGSPSEPATGLEPGPDSPSDESESAASSLMGANSIVMAMISFFVANLMA